MSRRIYSEAEYQAARFAEYQRGKREVEQETTRVIAAVVYAANADHAVKVPVELLWTEDLMFTRKISEPAEASTTFRAMRIPAGNQQGGGDGK